MKTKVNDFYTFGEELANSITHGIGALLSVAALTLLIVFSAQRGDPTHVISFTIYGCSLFILYLASTLYHSIQHPKAKRFLRTFDHASIYLLIAGTYTPFLVISMHGQLGVTLLVIVWGMALMGVVFKLFFVHRFEVLSTLAYVVMGWLCVVAYRQMLANIPAEGLLLLVAGGLSYTSGVLFFAWHKLPYNHAIWHLFVLGGSICHFFSVLYLIPGVLS